MYTYCTFFLCFIISYTLPLPSEIKQMYVENSQEIVDNPEKFGGKIRSFPHERGVWATYVFIECKQIFLYFCSTTFFFNHNEFIFTCIVH